MGRLRARATHRPPSSFETPRAKAREAPQDEGGEIQRVTRISLRSIRATRSSSRGDLPDRLLRPCRPEVLASIEVVARPDIALDAFGEIIDQNAHRRNESASAGEREMDGDFPRMPVGEDADQAFLPDRVGDHL